MIKNDCFKQLCIVLTVPCASYIHTFELVESHIESSVTVLVWYSSFSMVR